ncbi:MAG: sulfotransferase family 2 domain-containing protein [Phycisphaerales bacterium]|nr:sulfotransferase family 2 domain-containing protein [Phycisphaerales bacterium]
MASPLQSDVIRFTDNDLLIFTHIPKTAGMTFKRLLGKQFPADRMPKIGPDYQGSINQIKALSDREKDRVQCLSGHIPYGIHGYFPGRTPHYIAFVRDPVDRALSEYFFLAKRPQLLPLIGLDVNAKLTPDAYLEHLSSLGMQDFQTRALCGYNDLVESVLPPYPPMAVDDVDALIRDIIDAYAFIGTVERFDESLLLIKELFGWRSVCYVSRNVTGKNDKRRELKHTIAAEIRRLNPIDCILYSAIKARVDAAIAERGRQFAEELECFHRSNRRYAHVWTLYRATGLRRIQKLIAKLRAASARSAGIPTAGAALLTLS